MVATTGELGWFEEMAARRGAVLDVPMHPATRAYCDFLLALAYSGYPARITAIWALGRTYLESWESARPGAQPYREFVKRWTIAVKKSSGGQPLAVVAARVSLRWRPRSSRETVMIGTPK